MSAKDSRGEKINKSETRMTASVLKQAELYSHVVFCPNKQRYFESFMCL